MPTLVENNITNKPMRPNLLRKNTILHSDSHKAT